VKDLLIRAVQATIGEQEPPPPPSLSSSCDPADDSLFSFMSQTAADYTASTILTAEVDTYLPSLQLNRHGFIGSLSSHCSSISKIQ